MQILKIAIVNRAIADQEEYTGRHSRQSTILSSSPPDICSFEKPEEVGLGTMARRKRNYMGCAGNGIRQGVTEELEVSVPNQLLRPVVVRRW